MMNNKVLTILLIGSLLMLLAACSQNTDVSVEKDPKDTIIDNEPNEEQNNPDAEEDPVVEEEVIVLPSQELQKGDQGEEILVLQKALTKIGYEISPSKVYDLETVWAITDFQIQSDELWITGIYDEQTKLALEGFLDKESTITPGEGLPLLEEEYLDDDTVVIGNPYEVLSLVNKQHALPAEYVPSDLVIPEVRFPFVEDVPKKQMRKVAADALEKMFTDADKESLDLFAQSGYRSYERQDVLFASYVSNHGEEQANNFSARPGESEHQSGLTMDVTSPHVNYALVVEFGETEEGIWIEEHAADYGFIIRYPKGKEAITGYQYEPWHLRYVGVKAATEIMERKITLEEYIEEILTN
ncbi:D-alanyl-D-alanine carboxypeptidase family protein [Paucisalibacillus sp. EB02]|uniref:D-alanyl-D-alanine carboxypeptidase family protein n=1 Tax=Paucisalibacillus sp. EB02 TaxID=1347087 RepID=UPI0004B8AA76|nr:D-alanyl-D-alanine carboxypeptidase family protein [Paucisalibacillus sp. EB02]